MCVACGGNGQQCCTNAVCNADQLCDRPPSTWQSGRCLACGGLGEICCASGGCRAGGCTTLTFGDYCMGGPTNVRGGTCNPVNAYCSDGGLCSSDGYCFTCGGYLEPCCSGTGCHRGYTCISGACE
jgi:hypothetical protein